MADLFSPQRRDPPRESCAPARGFTRCAECNGMGFLRRGGFGDASYPRCEDCEGLGQIDLDPAW